MTTKRKKYQLPVLAELKHIQVDLHALKSALDEVSNEFVNVVESNHGFCDNNPALVDKVYTNFDQICLMKKDGPPLPPEPDVKKRNKRREELLYDVPTEHYTGSYFESLIRQFREKALRARITRLAPGTDVPHHIDYDPSYATRVVIPIHTNENVINEFRVKNQLQQYHLQEGKAYFLNTGFSHAVYNRGETERVALMFSLDGQSDLIFQ